MPRFLVKGVDRASRSDMQLIIDADSTENARVKGELNDLAVTSVTPLDTAPIGASQHLRPCNAWAVMLLSIITFSIYGAIWFYETGKSYARWMNASDDSNLPALFWWYFALSLIGGLTFPFVIGALLLIASLVVGVLALGEFIRLRDLCAVRLGIADQLTSGTTHRALWTIGFLLSIVVVGIPILIAQAILLIRDHNTLAHRSSQSRLDPD